MGVLDNQIIQGIKNKILPTNRGLGFQKNKPITPYNYPLTQRTKYKIYGYKTDKWSGIRRPQWLTLDWPTGRQLTPQALGLDGFYNIEVVSQAGLISPKEEQKKPELFDIPELPNNRGDNFKYSDNVINNRGYLKQNVARTD